MTHEEYRQLPKYYPEYNLKTKKWEMLERGKYTWSKSELRGVFFLYSEVRDWCDDFNYGSMTTLDRLMKV